MIFPESGKGTYCLLLKIETPASLTIGRLGTTDFAAGWYAYVGSAFGAGGLRGRLAHHLRTVTKPHWHIDYLRQSAVIGEIWYLADTTVHEHQWAHVLETTPEVSIPLRRFGASDCQCSSHLFYSTMPIDFAAFQQRAGIDLKCWNPLEHQS
jgi:Uri superfamily endonuclease